MPNPSNDPAQPRPPRGERPFRGWTWRGARLTERQSALFIPGRQVKHLGIPTVRLGQPIRAPVHFAVYVHQGWRRGERVALPADARFEVWAVLPLAGHGTCLVLEQLDERLSDPSAFRRSMARWLRRFPPELPAATAADLAEQEQPFARWLPESRPGEPPLEGPIYDFEAAVRYASAWTGLDQALVWRILEASERYLELAGIAQAEEDAALAAERREAVAWLPGQAPSVDERAEGYIAWATGLEPAAIAAVRRGELAYLDHLGLVVWGRDGEREECLGPPAWPLAGYRQKMIGI